MATPQVNPQVTPQVTPAPAWQVGEVLKRDSLGRVERLQGPGGVIVRRVACGSRVPGSRWLARLLLARERRAHAALAGCGGVAALVENGEALVAPAADGPVPDARDVLLRGWIEGRPLWAAERLPRDFFERLEEVVAAAHERGVCHNDLHKENNVLVGEDGRPWLVDFQLASLHRRESRSGRIRRREDIRHVHKHRRRYEQRGEKRPVPRARRSPLAWVWRRLGKPLYTLVTRGLFPGRRGEPRRPSSGPWPEWTEPLGTGPARPPMGAGGAGGSGRGVDDRS